MSLETLPQTLASSVDGHSTPLPPNSEKDEERRAVYLGYNHCHTSSRLMSSGSLVQDFEAYDINLHPRRNYMVGNQQNSGTTTAILNSRVPSDNYDATNNEDTPNNADATNKDSINGFTANNMLRTPIEYFESQEDIDFRIMYVSATLSGNIHCERLDQSTQTSAQVTMPSILDELCNEPASPGSLTSPKIELPDSDLRLSLGIDSKHLAQRTQTSAQVTRPSTPDEFCDDPASPNSLASPKLELPDSDLLLLPHEVFGAI
ncbi:hypothetical protein NHQ30_008153 [Ciborinia camelliae]|nr:hypothetical protein NHQ30_008153 [Ciborinia camelliae]